MTNQSHPEEAKNAQARKEWTAWRCDWERALISYPFLSGSDYAVGIEIARSARAETKQAWPSQELIAARIGRSVSSVEKSAKRLERLGFLEVEKMAAGSGRAFNLYTLLDNRINAALDHRQAIADLWHTARVEVSSLVASWQAFVRKLVHPPKPDPQDLTGQEPYSPSKSYGSDPQDLTGNHLHISRSIIGSEKEDEDSQDWTHREAS